MRLLSVIFLMNLFVALYARSATASFPVFSIYDSAPTQNPDLYWKPEAFIAESSSSTDRRYIDFQRGNDSYDGTRERPWKHHPWDSNATGKAAIAWGVQTYIFKKGVTYRGRLNAKESGQPGKPVKLTVDPSWGKGEAVISGSVEIRGGWRRCTEEEAKILPPESRNVTWCREFKSEYRPRAVWEVRGDEITAIPIARTPNWRISLPQDPQSEWASLGDAIPIVKLDLTDANGFRVNDEIWLVKTGGRQSRRNKYRVVEVLNKSIRIEARGLKKRQLQQLQARAKVTNGKVTAEIEHPVSTRKTVWKLFNGPQSQLVLDSGTNLHDAVIWVERASMPKPVAGLIDTFDLKDGVITTNIHVPAVGGPRKHSRYYLEDAASFLDTPGEYYYAPASGRTGTLYMRLPGDRNPNGPRIEVATRSTILEISGHSHIHVSGLSFRFSNQLRPGTRAARHAPMHAAAIQIRGTVSDINIHHCKFEKLASGIVAYPAEGQKQNRLDYLKFTDNTFLDIDGSAIALGDGQDRVLFRASGARLNHIVVSRNKLERVGLTAMGRSGVGSLGHAIDISGGEIVEVVGNHINYSGGSGIFLLAGPKHGGSKIDYPLIRGLIHHNKVTNSVLKVQDYGGIEAWMGGPVFLYNNISGNPVGHKHTGRGGAEFRRRNYGIGIYLDGQYKAYVFNNIIWGYNNDISDKYYNAAGFNEAMGFMHSVFNNTIYNFAVGLHKGVHQHNRCYYLGNLLIDMGHKFIQQEPANEGIEIGTLAFTGNVFSGSPVNFGQLGRGSEYVFPRLKDWVGYLKKEEAIKYDTGIHTGSRVIQNKETHDFRPLVDSAAIDAGVKMFVPWPLYGVVGEWHFLQSWSDPSVIQGENLNFDGEWVDRFMSHYIPRNNLQCTGVHASDYSPGILEDWVNGALRFNGYGSFCILKNQDLMSGFNWTKFKSEKSGHVKSRDRETVDMSTNNFLIESVLAVKAGGQTAPIINKVGKQGYELAMDKDGRVKLTLHFGGSAVSRTSSLRIDDGNWHHLIAEVDRRKPEGIDLYVDGRLVNGQWTGEMNSTASLSNSSDFIVGRSEARLFKGKLDFLRISKGTLKDARTSIDELYEWEFNGPFLRDFSGKPASGKSRDAGAVEAN